MVSPVLDAAEAEIARAKRAAALLEEDSVFHEAWQALGEKIEHAWRTSPVRDTDGRERLFLMRRAMDDLRIVLDGFVQNGAVALDRIEQDKREGAAGF